MTNDITKIKCLEDLLNNYHLFFGKYINYNEGEWHLDENDNNYQLEPKFFNCLDENIRLFNYRYSSYYGKRHYYIEPNDITRLAFYDKFLYSLMDIMIGKTFKSLSHITMHCIDHNFSCVTSKVRFPLGMQGRFDDVACLIIRGRGSNSDKSIFIPYWGHSQSITQFNKLFKNLLRIYILLYRPDLNYPYTFEGNKRTLNIILANLYSKIVDEDFAYDSKK